MNIERLQARSQAIRDNRAFELFVVSIIIISALLIGAYLLWGIAGIYFPDQYARPFMGSSIPIGLAVGTLIIMMSIALSIVYVRIIDRIETEASVEKEKAT